MGKSRERTQNNGCQREWKLARGEKNCSVGDVQKLESGNGTVNQQHPSELRPSNRPSNDWRVEFMLNRFPMTFSLSPIGSCQLDPGKRES